VGLIRKAGSICEAQGDKEYKDLAKTPEAIANATAMLAANPAHLARLLKESNYPGIKE
jgi:hypothetical protein